MKVLGMQVWEAIRPWQRLLVYRLSIISGVNFLSCATKLRIQILSNNAMGLSDVVRRLWLNSQATPQQLFTKEALDVQDDEPTCNPRNPLFSRASWQATGYDSNRPSTSDTHNYVSIS